ncbi:MAG: hypothetical protein HQL41_06595 [Alphaproteobacteria bacterium]|nr:hypothetical protein [Alphaproteobacteria bacterium]
MPSPTRLPAYELDLCIADINRLLNLTLSPGRVWFSSAAHAKTATRHARDYNVVLRHLGACCRAPTYIGLHAKHPGNVELILEAPDDDGASNVLVAITVTPNARGNYSVKSAYRILEDEVAERIARGSVHRVTPETQKARNPQMRSEPSESPTRMQSRISWEPCGS